MLAQTPGEDSAGQENDIVKERRGFYNSDTETIPAPSPERHPEVALLANCPIIAAVNSPETFPVALASPTRAIYLLTGNPLTLPGMLHRARESGKVCLVNIDFLDGLARDRFAVEFLAEHKVAGIVSTRCETLMAAHALSLVTVQRTFGIDSAAVAALKKSLAHFLPDSVEVLPAMAAPKLARRIRETYPALNIIGGGLIENVKEIEELLASGINAISVSDPRLWLI